jgi:hypothetical protein
MNNDLSIQYSHSIEWDYSKGILPSGRETTWTWEESYIPVEHKKGSKVLGKHEFMRVKVGVQGIWSVPMRIVGVGIKSVSTVLKSSLNGTKTYAIETTYDDGTVTESDSLLTVVDGKDGKDGADAENFDSASEWFDTETDLKAFTGYIDNQYYGIFENRSIYQYRSGATSGIKPDDITGNGRYVLTSDLSSTFATEADMDENPMVMSTKAVAPSTLQYWWDNQSVYTENEVDTLLWDKVDKVVGYGLSENNYSTDDKNRLASTSGNNTGDQDISNLLSKTLLQNYVFVGNGFDVASGVKKDTLFRVCTVGSAGQYSTLQLAYDAGNRLFLQDGTLVDNGGLTATELCIFISKDATLGGLFSTKLAVQGNITVTQTCYIYSLKSSAVTLSLSSSGAFAVENVYDSTITATNGNVSITVTSGNNCVITGYTGATCALNNCVNIRLLGSLSDCLILNCTNIDGNSLTLTTLRVTGQAEPFGYSRINYNISFVNSTVHFIGSNTQSMVGGAFSAITCDNPKLNLTSVKLSLPVNLSGNTINGSIFNRCEFLGTLTLPSGVELKNCVTTGVVLSGTKNSIIGGVHTTILINANTNIVSNTVLCSSITLGAVTGCNITNNLVDTEITIVSGNNIHSNIVY